MQARQALVVVEHDEFDGEPFRMDRVLRIDPR